MAASLLPTFHNTHRSAGRSTHQPHQIPSSIDKAPIKLTLTTRDLRSHSSLSRYDSASPGGSPLSPESNTGRRSLSRSNLRGSENNTNGKGSNMATPSPLSPLSPGSASGKQSMGNHAKLHKRGGSNSLPGPPSPFVNGAHFTTPFATYEESSFPDTAPSQSQSSTPKIKPYLRKMSIAKEDQGSIDLSKSMAENDRLAGLGIQDFGNKSAADVSFTHTGRRQHGRTISGGSAVSNASGNFRHGHSFTHPMTKTPRPYTPPTGRSYASSLVGDEADESDDVVDDDFRLGAGFRTKRSMSISSTPQTNPTPLSQAHNASDLGLVPKLTCASQSNLSINSTHSGISAKKGRPRRDTDRSDNAISPSSRTSFDRAFSLVGGRKQEVETQSREELIRAARRKFEEREAKKDRKYSKDAARREEQKQRKISNATERPTHTLKHAHTDGVVEKKRRKSSAATATAGAEEEKKMYSRSYEDYRPAHASTLPRYGNKPGESEKASAVQFTSEPAQHRTDGGWTRFSTWVQTRMLSCGDRN